jgi:hypothetical protein
MARACEDNSKKRRGRASGALPIAQSTRSIGVDCAIGLL